MMFNKKIKIFLLLCLFLNTIAFSQISKEVDLFYALIYFSSTDEINQVDELKELLYGSQVTFIIQNERERNVWEEAYYLVALEKLKFIPIEFIEERARNNEKPVLFYFSEVFSIEEMNMFITLLDNSSFKTILDHEIYEFKSEENNENNSNQSLLNNFSRFFLYLLLGILLSLMVLFFYSRKKNDQSLFGS